MELDIFDVEHGACALLTCNNGTRMMIDCGHNSSTGWRPGDYLRSISVSHIDMLVVTNYDEDHVSGLCNLQESVTIGSLYRNGSVSSAALSSLKHEYGMGPGIEALAGMMDRFTGPPLPPETFANVVHNSFCLSYPAEREENNLSLVLHLRIAGVGFLFPGDLEISGWKRLLESDEGFRSAVKEVGVLVAAHHGRESGLYPELFTVYGCRPHWVVISDDVHQFETQKASSRYSGYAKGANFRGVNRKAISTRNDGHIHFWFSNGNWGAT